MTNDNKKIVLSGREKTVLLLLKSGLAFFWGFVNAITIIQSNRFATMMTGNLILLGMQIKDWDENEMLLTAVLIVMYILGGVTYDWLSLFAKNEKTILVSAMSVVFFMGVLADVMQYWIQSCPDVEDRMACEAQHLYYLSPVSFLTGIVASGYCFDHPDGVITTLMTNHMRVAPNSLLKLCFLIVDEQGDGGGGPSALGKKQQQQQRSALLEKARTSVVIICFFFCGVLTGDVVEDRIVQTYFKGRFSPLFTITATMLVVLCSLHSTFYRRCFNTFQGSAGGDDDDFIRAGVAEEGPDSQEDMTVISESCYDIDC